MMRLYGFLNALLKYIVSYSFIVEQLLLFINALQVDYLIIYLNNLL
jgi:hypothetical protein